MSARGPAKHKRQNANLLDVVASISLWTVDVSPRATKNVRTTSHHRSPDIRRRSKDDSCIRLASEQDGSHLKNSDRDALVARM